MLREVILTVLAHRPMTGYEIAQSFDRTLSHFWRASHQQIYRELGRMRLDGCVSFRAVSQSGKPGKKIYAISKAGRAELQRWVAAPTDPPRPQADLLVKLLAGLLVNPKALELEMSRVAKVTAAYLDSLRAMYASCRRQPLDNGYDQALYLALRRGLLVVGAQSEWLREVSRFLSSGKLKRITK